MRKKNMHVTRCASSPSKSICDFNHTFLSNHFNPSNSLQSRLRKKRSRHFYKHEHENKNHSLLKPAFSSDKQNNPMATVILHNPFKFKTPYLKISEGHHCHSQTSKINCSSSLATPAQSTKQELLTLISDQERGLKTQKNPEKLASIVEAIDKIAAFGADTVTTNQSLSGTWRLLWTTEKEQLFIIEKAYLFGTQAGDVLQVIDVEKGALNNVITFPPDGVFFVRSNIEVASSQRVNFRFTSAVLRGKSWEIPLPPFGQGWFETVYLDDEIRVVKDIRKDYLVVERAPYAWKE